MDFKSQCLLVLEVQSPVSLWRRVSYLVFTSADEVSVARLSLSVPLPVETRCPGAGVLTVASMTQNSSVIG